MRRRHQRCWLIKILEPDKEAEGRGCKIWKKDLETGEIEKYKLEDDEGVIIIHMLRNIVWMDEIPEGVILGIRMKGIELIEEVVNYLKWERIKCLVIHGRKQKEEDKVLKK